MVKKSKEVAKPETRNEIFILKKALELKRGEINVGDFLSIIAINDNYARAALQHKEILRIAEPDGWSVAHTIACINNPKILRELKKHSDILELSNDDGFTVKAQIEETELNGTRRRPRDSHEAEVEYLLTQLRR